MSRILASLHRLRVHARRESDQTVRRAELEHRTQEVRVAEVRDGIVRARAAVEETDVAALAHYHQFRLKEEMSERRETARLAQKARDLEAATRAHHRNVRDELSIQNVIEEQAQRAAEDEKRSEMRDMDEIASRRGLA